MMANGCANSVPVEEICCVLPLNYPMICRYIMLPLFDAGNAASLPALPFMASRRRCEHAMQTLFFSRYLCRWRRRIAMQRWRAAIWAARRLTRIRWRWYRAAAGWR